MALQKSKKRLLTVSQLSMSITKSLSSENDCSNDSIDESSDILFCLKVVFVAVRLLGMLLFERKAFDSIFPYALKVRTNGGDAFGWPDIKSSWFFLSSIEDRSESDTHLRSLCCKKIDVFVLLYLLIIRLKSEGSHVVSQFELRGLIKFGTSKRWHHVRKIAWTCFWSILSKCDITLTCLS